MVSTPFPKYVIFNDVLFKILSLLPVKYLDMLVIPVERCLTYVVGKAAKKVKLVPKRYRYPHNLGCRFYNLMFSK